MRIDRIGWDGTGLELAGWVRTEQNGHKMMGT
jgi:hypothetical protein